MLKPAQLYRDSICKKYAEIMYDLDYQYYFGSPGTEIPEISDNTYNRRWFASVNELDEVIGLITYGMDAVANSCYNFGIISFKRGTFSFIVDVKQAINDIFCKYKFNRIEFQCFSDNPAIKGYRAFIKKYGGREVGYLRQTNKLLDGELHDSVLFEILKDEYKVNDKEKH